MSRPCHFLTQRLWETYEWPDVPMYRVIKRGDPKSLHAYRAQPAYISDHERTLKSPTLAWDIGRIRFFYEELKAGKCLDPVLVDNECEGMHIYPIPILLDGHHRLAAHWLAKVPTIPVHYGGRIDLKNYLTGRRKTCPKE